MSNTIKLKRGSGSDPSASDLSVGEVALRTDTAKLFTKKDDNSVAEIGAGISDGDKGDITVSNSGATFTIDNDAVTTAKINANAVGLSELFQHNNEGFIATANGSDCVVNTYPTYAESGNVFVVHDIKLNRDSNNNDPVIGAGASPASVTFRTNQDGASGAGIASILNGGGLQMGRMTEYVKLAAPTDQTGQSSYTFTFPITGGSANQLLLTNGSGTTSFSFVSNASVASDAAIARTKLANVDLVDDTTPQLGGDLDVQSSKITTATSNGNVKIEPNGTGVVEIRGAGGNDGALQLNCSAQSHGIKLVSPAHSASQSYTLIFPDNQIAADKYLKVKSISGSGSTATGQLEFEALDANDLGEGTIPDARFPSTLPALNGSALTNLNASNIASGTISASRVPTLNQNTTGSAATLTTARTIGGTSFNGSANIDISYNNLTNLPTIPSNNNQLTNGAGFITDLVNDSSPQLGGNLDTNGYYIAFDDNRAASFGNGDDLQLYHNSDVNYLDINNGTLKIRLASTADFIELQQDRDVWIKGNPKPWSNNTYALGTSSYKWSAVHATTFYGDGSNLTGVSGGKVLQVVNSRLSSAFSTSSSSYTATGHYVTVSNIASASSKILVIASGTTINTNANGGRIALFRQVGSGSYSNLASDYIATFWGEGDSNNVEGTSSFQFLDTAGSSYASGLTYQVYIRNWGGGTAYWSYRGNTASLTAIEISA